MKNNPNNTSLGLYEIFIDNDDGEVKFVSVKVKGSLIEPDLTRDSYAGDKATTIADLISGIMVV